MPSRECVEQAFGSGALAGVAVTRRDALEALLASNPRITDWRTVGGIDADGILEERRRFAGVRDALPAGVTLDATTD